MKFIILSLLAVVFFGVIGGVIWPCQNSSECTDLSPDARCSSGGNCLCPPHQVYSISSVSCISSVLYGQNCEESIQCSLMPSGATCIKGVCECEAGLTYVRGRCRKLKGLEKQCNEDIDCWFGYDRESVTCSNKICKCATNYYKRHSTICRRLSEVGDFCIVNTDCKTLKCENSFCAAAVNSSRIQLKDAAELPHSITINSIKSTEFHNNSQNNNNNKQNEERSVKSPNDHTIPKKFGDTCTNNKKPCDGLAHSTCVDNVCYCLQGYYPHPTKNICMAELGESATLENCEFEYAPGTGKCICNYNGAVDKVRPFYGSDLRSCKKAILFVTPCLDDSQCSPFAAYCETERPRHCKCPSYAVFNEDEQLCVTKDGLGGPCEATADCSAIPNADCSNENICECNDKYHSSNGKCLAGIGAPCKITKDCDVKNAECVNSKQSTISNTTDTKTCACTPNFTQVGNECVKKADDIEDPCVDDIQCEPLLAKCVEEKCTCTENHHFSYGKCHEKKNLGDQCTKLGECYMKTENDSVECKNSVCRCKLDYKPNENGHICIKAQNNASGRPSALKIITFLLFGSAFLVTSAALREAYY